MKITYKRLRRLLLPLFLAAVCAFVPALSAAAEEGSDQGYYDEDGNWIDTSGEENDDDSGEEEPETEFIPEEYYDPIQTNEIAGWPQGPAVQAAGAVVMDMDTGTFLYSKNADKRYFPASITKIMTTLVALDSGVDLDKKVVCGDEVYDIESDASSLYAESGEEFTMRQLLYGVMLASANEMANTVAVQIGGSIEGFADLMNQKAAQIGCTGTHFVNPNGLHNDDHYTTAHDMALIGQAAYNIPEFREIVSTPLYTIPKTNKMDEDRVFENHHKMIRKDSGYFQDWCGGGKTGYTNAAWNTLVTFGEKNGRRMVCVLLHENGGERAVTETADLMNYGFDNFTDAAVTQDEKIPTFAELLGMKRPDNPDSQGLFLAPQLNEPVYNVVQPGIVTVPNGTDTGSLTRKTEAGGVIAYLYQNWQVGRGQIQLSPIPTGIVMPFEQYRDVEAIEKVSQESDTKKNIQATAHQAVINLENLAADAYEKVKDYVDHNRMTVFLAGAFILLILCILIFILILRCTRQMRIDRKRAAAERQMRREAEEIDRKSAVEIEEELRAAMEAERKKQEERRKREAERQRQEEELRETERIIAEAENAHADHHLDQQ